VGRVRSVTHRSTNFGFWAGLPLVVFGLVANVLKLVINLEYLFTNPSAQVVGVDPITGFAVGLVLLGVVVYLLDGLRHYSIWAAVSLAAVMPLVYMVMVDGLVAAQLHQQMYFFDNIRASFEFELGPACVIVILYGAQAIVNYNQHFRRVKQRSGRRATASA
jgi:hypothetical protein